MTVAGLATAWNDIVAMGLLVLGYGIVAAAFYTLITKTAKAAPEFPNMANSGVHQATVIDITERYEKKKAA